MTVPGKGGRPVSYTPEQLEQGIIDYFLYVDDINKERKELGEKLKPYTLSGICVYLDICKETFWDYAKKQAYVDPIKRARAKVENYVEEGLLNGAVNAIGAIFNLKNNFGWVDKMEINTTTGSEKLTNDDIQDKINELKKKQNKVESVDTE